MLHNYVSCASLHQPAITILSHGPLHTLHLCTACTYLVIATHYIFNLGQVTEALTQQTSNLGTTSFSFPQLRSNDPKPKMPFTEESSEEFEKRITQQLLQLWKYLIKIITMLLWRVYLCHSTLSSLLEQFIFYTRWSLSFTQSPSPLKRDL